MHINYRTQGHFIWQNICIVFFSVIIDKSLNQTGITCIGIITANYSIAVMLQYVFAVTTLHIFGAFLVFVRFACTLIAVAFQGCL